MKLLMLLSFCGIIVVVFPSCASRKVAKTSKTETASPSAQQSSASIKRQNTDDEEPFVVVEEMPLFPGGDSMLLDYIARNTKYPEAAKINKIQGRVIIRFCVTAKGTVNRISVLKSVNPEIDAEAIRVTGTLPTFKPGRQSGRDVPVWYMIPITFALK